MTEQNFELPQALEFDACCELFSDLGSRNSPSELHGQLTGYLAAGAVFNQKQWLKLASDFLELNEVPEGTIADELEEFYQVTATWLASGSMEFRPLLADEDCPVDERLQSLADWCAGFLAGFALSGKTTPGQYPPDVEETMRDLAEISQVGLAEDEEGISLDEKAWFEITEYVRLAALNLYYELSPPVAGEQGQEKLH